jgi:hypothetical protein
LDPLLQMKSKQSFCWAASNAAGAF